MDLYILTLYQIHYYFDAAELGASFFCLAITTKTSYQQY